MNVFVLGTGRCGSVGFATACGHLSNYTSAHESLSGLAGSDRLDYPDGHIEIDNRLSWFLGSLARQFPDDETFYVHLRRDRQAVVSSFMQRWDSPFRASIIRAFAHGIVMRREDWSDEDVRIVCESYVTTVDDNVAEFLRTRRSMEIWIESAIDDFPGFADRIGATGDLDAAVAELSVRHNAS